jgi:predicted transcriptional regulator
MSKNMQTSTVLSVRVNRKAQKSLEYLSSELYRSKSSLAAEAIQEYLKVHEWRIRAIKEGLKEAEEGKLIDHSKVKEWLRSWGKDKKLPPPQCN